MNIQVNFSVKSVTVGEWPETGTVLHTCPAEPVFPERLTLWPFLGTGGQQWASRQEVCPWGLEAWPVLGAFWEDRKDCCDPGPRAVGHSWWLSGSVPWLGVLPPEDPPGLGRPSPSFPPHPVHPLGQNWSSSFSEDFFPASSCATPLGLVLEADEDLLNPGIWTFQR